MVVGSTPGQGFSIFSPFIRDFQTSCSHVAMFQEHCYMATGDIEADDTLEYVHETYEFSFQQSYVIYIKPCR
jgi:hypothetical protein